MKNPFTFIQSVIASQKIDEKTKARLEQIEFYLNYAEPGYQDPESGYIAVGTWNPMSEDKRDHATDLILRVARVLKHHYKADLRWSDEWEACDGCYGLMRSNALESDALCSCCAAQQPIKRGQRQLQVA